jgi:hypothetical protein
MFVSLYKWLKTTASCRQHRIHQRDYAPEKKNGIFEPFISKNEPFAKTGSGQTWGESF